MELSEIIPIIIKQIEKLGDSISPADKVMIKNALIQIFSEGSTVSEAMKFPKEDMEMMYAYSVSLYEGGKFADARNGFFNLFTLNPNDERYSFGLAASYHKLKDYHHAVEYYLVNTKLNKENPAPWAHSGDCYIHLGKLDLACVMLAKAVEVSGDDPAHAKLKNEAELIRQNLQKQINAQEEKIGAL